MKLPWILLGALLTMCLIMAFILVGETHYGRGSEHTENPAMQQSGRIFPSYSSGLWFAWLLGSVEIVLVMLCLTLGIQKSGRLGRMKVPLLVAGLVYLTIYALLIALSKDGADQASLLVLSFPAPSVVMMLALWPVIPLFLSLLYFLNFDSWILTPDDRRRFQRLREGRGTLPEDTS